MILSKKALEDFKALYFKNYGKKLTDDKANELGVRVLRFYKFKYLK